jgi:hypothetical protein
MALEKGQTTQGGSEVDDNPSQAPFFSSLLDPEVYIVLFS